MPLLNLLGDSDMLCLVNGHGVITPCHPVMVCRDRDVLFVLKMFMMKAGEAIFTPQRHKTSERGSVLYLSCPMAIYSTPPFFNPTEGRLRPIQKSGIIVRVHHLFECHF